MKLSARNILKGRVKNIKRGPISSLVTLEIAPQVEVVATITAESAAALKLKTAGRPTRSSKLPACWSAWMTDPVPCHCPHHDLR